MRYLIFDRLTLAGGMFHLSGLLPPATIVFQLGKALYDNEIPVLALMPLALLHQRQYPTRHLQHHGLASKSISKSTVHLTVAQFYPPI